MKSCNFRPKKVLAGVINLGGFMLSFIRFIVMLSFNMLNVAMLSAYSGMQSNRWTNRVMDRLISGQADKPTD